MRRARTAYPDQGRSRDTDTAVATPARDVHEDHGTRDRDEPAGGDANVDANSNFPTGAYGYRAKPSDEHARGQPSHSDRDTHCNTANARGRLRLHLRVESDVHQSPHQLQCH